jgi:heme/copper-type cytochrome/quinol oxidase subunit 2
MNTNLNSTSLCSTIVHSKQEFMNQMIFIVMLIIIIIIMFIVIVIVIVMLTSFIFTLSESWNTNQIPQYCEQK